MSKDILFCWSGGKDSSLALHEVQKAKSHNVAALLTTITEDYDRISMHGVRRALLEQQAEALGLPLKKVLIPKEATNDIYESRMRALLEEGLREGIDTVAFGDIFLEDLKLYRENNLAQLGMKGLFPIWKQDSAELAQTFINLGFKAVLACIDTKFLDPSFAGRPYDQDLLRDLPPNVDPCGENGEFHSFAFDGPIFKHRINHTVGEVVRRDRYCFCDLVPA
ncbi:MAG: diphthine--ammonia ligase [Acidobacteriota bacterium]|nr:diphthine--ammonia ligase [Acidobacteriota bacterium]